MKTTIIFILTSYYALISSAYCQIRYCRDFTPGIQYYDFELPEYLIDRKSTRFSAEQIRFALLNSFFEQLPIIMLSEDDDFFKKYVKTDINSAVKSYLGYADIKSTFMEPIEKRKRFDDLNFLVIDSNVSFAFTDSKSVFLSKKLIKLITVNAIIKNFGSIDAYKNHISLLMSLTTNTDGFPKETDIGYYVFIPKDMNNPSIVPIGRIISTETYSNERNFKNLFSFVKDVTARLMFVGAHEAGHIKLNHFSGLKLNCKSIITVEDDADNFASKYLAKFIFDLSPENAENYSILDYRSFFNTYYELQLNNSYDSIGCHYRDPAERLQRVIDASKKEIHELLSSTMIGVDYSSPRPTHGLCNTPNGQKRVLLR